MTIIYAPRAVRDLAQIAVYYRTVASPGIATAIRQRIENVIRLVERMPLSAAPVVNRRNVRVVLLRTYPYKIFYRTRANAVEILHIRHTSRRPWAGG